MLSLDSWKYNNSIYIYISILTLSIGIYIMISGGVTFMRGRQVFLRVYIYYADVGILFHPRFADRGWKNNILYTYI